MTMSGSTILALTLASVMVNGRDAAELLIRQGHGVPYAGGVRRAA
jgi:endonuclease YncB( thermonuclease family)